MNSISNKLQHKNTLEKQQHTKTADTTGNNNGCFTVMFHYDYNDDYR